LTLANISKVVISKAPIFVNSLGYPRKGVAFSTVGYLKSELPSELSL
jgi:hypothetical protein